MLLCQTFYRIRSKHTHTHTHTHTHSHSHSHSHTQQQNIKEMYKCITEMLTTRLVSKSINKNWMASSRLPSRNTVSRALWEATHFYCVSDLMWWIQKCGKPCVSVAPPAPEHWGRVIGDHIMLWTSCACVRVCVCVCVCACVRAYVYVCECEWNTSLRTGTSTDLIEQLLHQNILLHWPKTRFHHSISTDSNLQLHVLILFLNNSTVK